MNPQPKQTISKTETVEEAAIRLLFKGNQAILWHLLDFRPRPTWIFAELMELPSKNISKQLSQMSKRTGLVRFENRGKLKEWYKIEQSQHSYSGQEVRDIIEQVIKRCNESYKYSFGNNSKRVSDSKAILQTQFTDLLIKK